MRTHALILDAETTGLVDPQPIQVAYKGPLEFGHHLDDFPAAVVNRFKPTKPIEPGAMATHRIIPAMLDDCTAWPGWAAHVAGTTLESDLIGYLVGFGIDYDWQLIGGPDLKRIDLLALAKRVWDGLGSYKQTSLIFHLYEPRTALELTADAHDAECDIYLSALVLEHLLADILEGAPDRQSVRVESWEQLWLLSEDARIPLRIGFSKYGPKNGQPGAPYTEVPTGMLKWILDPARVGEMDYWEVRATHRELQRRGEYVPPLPGVVTSGRR